MTTENTETANPELLMQLVEAAKSARLTMEQEKQAATLLQSLILAGKAELESVIDPLLALPWIVGVNATGGAWPELKVTARRQLLKGLAACQTEQARRFRLSLGRGLLSQDPAASLKLVAEVCAEMNSTGDDAPLPKDRQIFSNVLLGKGKPWLLHLALADFKPADAAAVLQTAVATCFPGQCPPLTQLFVLRWIGEAGKLAKLPAESLEAIAKSLKRWNPKLRAELKTSVPELPKSLEDALGEAQESQLEQKPQPQKRQPQEQANPERRENRVKKTEPRREPPRGGNNAPAGFDLAAALRQIDAHVLSLRTELNQAKNELRQRSESTAGGDGRNRRRNDAETAPSSSEIESLQRHNLQLQETITELRQRLEELAADHEDVATSMRAHDEQPLTDEKEQFRALLGIKLQTDYAEFRELTKEPPDPVYREPYRLLLEDVFDVLKKHGIEL